MAKECSFDVVSDLDMQEVDNAVNQCVKEISSALIFEAVNQRFPWKEIRRFAF